ncbi:MAG: putative 4-hydroxybenzoate polyprenyltransferase [Bryobacterales bacterium]|nr:putative 4-hydroxybenzoate polyprenyltransferase [Bryobacterales bacterium]
MPQSFWRRLRLTLEMIKFEHSVFALPFALTGALLAAREDGFLTRDLGWKLTWIVVAMVSARSAAMSFNRVLDAGLDAKNPRTQMRHLPARLLSLRFAWGFIVISGLVFLMAARALNPLCFALAPVALGVLFFYSFTKRFTSFSHIVLGFCLGIAPAAAWIAVRGSLDPRILWLTAAVTFWTAGFDIIYSCQDYEFDHREGLFSLPRIMGIAGALWVSRIFHVAMLGCLAMLAWTLSLGLLSISGIVAVALLLTYEHSLVKANDLTRVDAAFFTMNGWVSMLFFFFWAADIIFLRRGV